MRRHRRVSNLFRYRHECGAQLGPGEMSALPRHGDLPDVWRSDRNHDAWAFRLERRVQFRSRYPPPTGALHNEPSTNSAATMLNTGLRVVTPDLAAFWSRFQTSCTLTDNRYRTSTVAAFPYVRTWPIGRKMPLICEPTQFRATLFWNGSDTGTRTVKKCRGSLARPA